MRHRRRPDAGWSVALTGPESETFDTIAGGRRLEVVRWRVASRDGASVIVLLHEGLGSVSAWRDFPRQLAQRTGREVVAYSRYGYGRSERLDGVRDISYMHDEALVVLPELLANLEIEKPIVMGHSDGASIAIVFAGAHPHDATALVLEAPHVFVEDLSVASIARAKSAFETTDLASKLARHHDDATSAFAGWNDIWLDTRFRSWNIESYLETIVVPVLVLQGSDDEYGTMAQIAAIERRTQARVVILEGCGHAPHRERHERALDEIARFVAEV